MNKPPHGYNEIAEFYNWKDSYLDPTSGNPFPSWELEHMMILSFPIGVKIPLSWNKDQSISGVKINKAVLKPFQIFFNAIEQQNFWSFLSPYGGGYTFRRKRVSHMLSLHAFGGALDFNPQHNPMVKGIVSNWEIGAKPFAMDLRIVEIARECGIKWGGDFDDPMHFQYGTGF